MKISVKQLAYAGVLLALGLGVGRAAMFRFQEKEKAIREQCRAELAKLGGTRESWKAKYPTPEIRTLTSGCLLPGGTTEVVARGKFAPGTHFIIQSDDIEVVKEAQTLTEYRATVKAAPGVGPQTAALVAITPVTGITMRSSRPIVVGGKYEWTMEAQNGWRVVARSIVQGACGDIAASSESQPYELLFYRKGEANPFEKRRGTLYHSVWEQTNYRFSVESPSQQQQSGEDLQAMMKQLTDPKTTEAQRNQLMKRMEAAQQQMMQQVQAQIKEQQDPNYAKKMEAQKAQFGCERIFLKAPAANFTGEMQCSPNVGAHLQVTGSFKSLGQ